MKADIHAGTNTLLVPILEQVLKVAEAEYQRGYDGGYLRIIKLCEDALTDTSL